MLKILLAIFIMILFFVGIYFLTSFLIYKVAKNNNYERSWLSFIPIIREYFLFDLIDGIMIYKIYLTSIIIQWLLFFSITNVGIIYFYFPTFTFLLYRLTLIICACCLSYSLYKLSIQYDINKGLTISICIILIINGIFSNDFSFINISFIFTLISEFIKIIFFYKLYKNSLN